VEGAGTISLMVPNTIPNPGFPYGKGPRKFDTRFIKILSKLLQPVAKEAKQQASDGIAACKEGLAGAEKRLEEDRRRRKAERDKTERKKAK